MTTLKTVVLTGGQTVQAHTEDQCRGRACCIHNPSNHHMLTWPQVWSSDRQLMERACPCGVEHPDPDHMSYVLQFPGPVGERASGVHGCCGCCVTADAEPANDHPG